MNTLMKSAITAVVLLGYPFTVPAIAADVTYPAYDWSGFYVGVNAGYADFDSNWYDIDDDWGNGNNPTVWDGYEFDAGSDGITVGGQFGYNYQVNNIVFGIEGSINYSDTRKTFESAANNVGDSPLGGDGTVENNLNGFGTVRGRLGLAFDRLLPYATAGVAFGDFDHEWTEFGDPTDSWPDFGGIDVGWVAGGGFEYAFSDSISFKGEALYMDFGNVTSRNEQDYRMKVDRSAVVISAGVNFSF